MKGDELTEKDKVASTYNSIVAADSNRPAVTLDVEKYRKYLEDANLTPEQEREFIEALWSIVANFVSMGFGVHPVQQAQNACGQVEGNSSKPALTAPDDVNYTDDFNAT